MATINEVLKKLQKLKQQAAIAPDFTSLEKVSAKVDKIRAKLQDHDSKELISILDKIDLLVKQKNKYFRRKTIQNSSKLINENTVRNQEAERTLKYSKSADSLKHISKKEIQSVNNQKTQSNGFKGYHESHLQGKTQNYTTKNNKQKTVHIRSARDQQHQKQNEELSQFLQTSSVMMVPQNNQNTSKRNIRSTIEGGSSSMKNITKNVLEPELDVEKTTVNVNKMYQTLQNEQKRRMQNQIGFLEHKLNYSFKQIEDLNNKISSFENKKQNKQADHHHFNSPMTKNYLKKQQLIVDEYNQKIRQKSFIIEDLKAKLEYFKSMNEQLKSRMINEQRTNQDYVSDLRAQIKNLKKQIERTKKDNDNLKSELDDIQEKNEGLISQVKKLVVKLQEEVKQKENIRKNVSNSASSRIQQLQKQVSRLTSQLLQASKIEVKFEQEQEQKQQIIALKNKTDARMIEIENQLKSVIENRDKIELDLYKLQQQNQAMAAQLKLNIQTKQLLAQQLLEMKQRLDQQLRSTGVLQYETELKAKNKLNKLKQIRSLLTQLR